MSQVICIRSVLPAIVVSLIYPALVCAQANYADLAAVSATMGVNANRVCIGEASRGDIGCPTYAPSVGAAGLFTASSIATGGLTVTGQTSLNNVSTSILHFRANADAPGQTFNGGVTFLRLEGFNASWSEPALEFAEQSNAPIARIAGKNTGSGGGDLIFMTRDSTSPVERMRISRIGNVGIGINTPLAALHVSGGAVLGSTAGSSAPNSTTSASLVIRGATANYNLNIQDGGGRVNHLWNATGSTGTYLASSEAAARFNMTPNSAGDGASFGFFSAPQGTIGNTITWTQLVGIEGGSTANAKIWFSPRGTSSDFYMAGTGGVGIGTSSPNSALHVAAGEVQVANSSAACSGANAGAIRYTGGALSFCNGTAWTTLATGSNADTLDGVDSTQFVRKDVGTQEVMTGSLRVSSNNATGGGLTIADDGDLVDLNDGYLAMRFSSGVRIHQGNASTGTRITLGSNGDITNSGAIYSSGLVRSRSGSNGWSDLNSGDGNPGFVSFFSPNGTRRGYIGYSDGASRLWIASENGWNYNFSQTPLAAGSVMWHAGNDGSGSGLDADTVDGWNPSISAGRVTMANVGCAGSWASSCDAGNNGYVDYADSAGSATDSTKVAKTGDSMSGALTVTQSGFNPSVNDLASIRVNGSWGGGLVFMEGGNRSSIYSASGADLRFATGGTSSGMSERMSISSAGRVGIGRFAGTYPLEVQGDTWINGTAFINNSAPTLVLQDTDNRTGYVHVNSDVMYFMGSASANQGYGSWSTFPLTLNLANASASVGGGGLTVTGETQLGNILKITDSFSGYTCGSGANLGTIRMFVGSLIYCKSDGWKNIVAANTSTYGMTVLENAAGAEAMRVQSTGQVYLGIYNTTAPVNRKYMRIGNDGTYMRIEALNDAYSAVQSVSVFDMANGRLGVANGSPNYTIDASGVVAGNGAYVNTSDRRLKTEIVSSTYGLETVMKLDPVFYHWRKPFDHEEGRRLGLIAQDVQPLVPEAVTEAHDTSKTLSMAYGTLVPVLIKAAQELKAENDNLRSRLDALERRLDRYAVSR